MRRSPTIRRPASLAETDNPSTWGTFADSRRAFATGKYSGLGYVRTGDYIFIDLDGCLDPQTREVAPWAGKIVTALTGKAYWEVSPSGDGFHGIALGNLPPGRRVWNSAESEHTGFAFYDGSRYFTMTGAVRPESAQLQTSPLSWPTFTRNYSEPTEVQARTALRAAP